MKNLSLILASAFVLLLTNNSYSQIFYPGGDSCSSAVPIPIGEEYYTPDDGPGTDNWYSFTAPCNGELTVSNSGDYESDKRIHSGVCGSLVLEAESSWVDDDVSHVMSSGESVYIVVNDSWDGNAEFNVEFEDCEAIDSALLDISGTVYYDLNNNGVQDAEEVVAPLSIILSDPVGIFSVANFDGLYYSSVAGLDDGTYEIYPDLDDYWGISTDSLLYTIMVDSLFEQRDSMDFGLYPDSLIYELNSELIGGFPRCNDTINYWLHIQNTGTTIASGQVHLELDDSLYYVSANISPDSVVGQNLYWTYEDLFFNEFHSIIVQVGTPDGLEDTVSSNLSVTIDSDGVEMFASTELLDQIIVCAYDPNDKTPTPLGVGEFGYISPETESIEYLIRFQNTGSDTAFNVVIEDQLDENLDWYSITPLAYSHDMQLEMDIDGGVSFIFNDILLPDSNVNELASHGFVKYRIDLQPDLPLETSILNTAYIYFDLNPAVLTNTAINTLHVDASNIDALMENQELLVYPNPFSETTTVYFAEDLDNYSIQIVDLLGNQVYTSGELNGNKLEIEADQFKAGMYILIVVDNDSNQVISNAKLIVN